MSENEVKITGEGTTKDKQQSSTKPATKEPKATKAAGKQESPAKVGEKKPTAIAEIMTTIKTMTVLELAELIKALEAEFGVSAAVPAVAATAAPAEAGATAEAAAEEQTEFSAILKDIGANKISVIKAVREVTTLGLKEAKDLVESAPATVKEGITKDEVNTIKQKLEDAGATVEIK